MAENKGVTTTAAAAGIGEKPLTGLTASVKIGSASATEVLAYISGVTLDVSTDIIEILAFGNQYKEKVPSIKDWSLSSEGTCAFVSGGSQEKLINAFDNSEALSFGIYLTDSLYFEGKGYVQKYSIDTAPDDKTNLSLEVAGTGAITHTFA